MGANDNGQAVQSGGLLADLDCLIHEIERGDHAAWDGDDFLRLLGTLRRARSRSSGLFTAARFIEGEQREWGEVMGLRWFRRLDRMVNACRDAANAPVVGRETTILSWER